MNMPMIEQTAGRLIRLKDRAIVAIDGVDGAGKTTFADLLAGHLVSAGRPVTRASVDGFHNPAQIRYLRGRESPQGFYHDSYNYVGLCEGLLDPFTRGSSEVLTSIYDHKTDIEKRCLRAVPPNAILVLDGIFLHRDQLLNHWDFSIFLSVPFATSYARMAQRDGSDPNPHAPVNSRYYQGLLLYLDECAPETKADLVFVDW